MSAARQPGWHFLQIPGPSPVPGRILRAISAPVIDHRGKEFQRLSQGVLEGIKTIFNTTRPVMIFPSAGSGGWEASLVNTLSPGDTVLMFETGHFAMAWSKVATKLGLDVRVVPGDWRRGVDPEEVERILSEDAGHAIKAVAVVHTETSTGATTNIGKVRQAMNKAGHPALLLVDAVSSLGCTEYLHDEWEVDVTVSNSQKGLMMPPGISFNAVSDKALKASKKAGFARSYWDWKEHLDFNATGFYPYTPVTSLLYGLKESLAMMHEEGLQSVFARHARHSEATRRAAAAWGLEVQCVVPEECSNTTTALRMPEGHDADSFRKIVLERFNMCLGTGLSKVKGVLFRIGHLGDFNDLMLAGTLSGVEMGLGLAGAPHNKGGVQAALEYLQATA